MSEPSLRPEPGEPCPRGCGYAWPDACPDCAERGLWSRGAMSEPSLRSTLRDALRPWGGGTVNGESAADAALRVIREGVEAMWRDSAEHPAQWRIGVADVLARLGDDGDA